MAAFWRNLQGALGLFALCLRRRPDPRSAQSIGVVQNDIIVMDTELACSRSRNFGQQMIADYNEDREALIARNREIEAELKAEEQALTAKRGEVSAEEFREACGRLRPKGPGIPRKNGAQGAGDSGAQTRERAPVEFMRRIEPILVELMNDAGADIIITKRQVLLASDVIDVTEIAIARVDAAYEPPASCHEGRTMLIGAEATGGGRSAE